MNTSLPLPPPPPQHQYPTTARLPGSGNANSPSFLHRRDLPPPIHTNHSLGQGAGLQQQAVASPYSYTPTAPTSTSPYAAANYSPSAFSIVAPPLNTESPRQARSPSAGMEYNPQQWTSQPTGVQFRTRGAGASSGLTIPTGRGVALDDAGRPLESPPPPYSPAPIQSIAQNLGMTTPIRGSTSLSSPPIRTTPTIQTSNLSSPPLNLAAEYASPASAITVISPFTQRNRNEPPPTFAPPPGAASSSRDRSTSRGRFTLSALTNRGKSTERSNTNKAIDTLHQNTRDALAFAPTTWGGRNSPQPEPHQLSAAPNRANRNTMFFPPAPPPPAPPSAQRSASAGVIGHRQPNVQPGQSNWTPGMPLPPPPPMPPAASSRSASVSSMSRSSEEVPTLGSIQASENTLLPTISAPIRRPPHRGTQLGPVPPTPAGWTEFPKSPMPPQMRHDSAPDALPTQSTGESSSSIPRSELSLSSSIGLSSASGRDPSIKPIRVRRSESRAARDRSVDAYCAGESSSNGALVQSPDSLEAKPADLNLVSGRNGSMSRQSAVRRAKASPIESRRSMKSPMRNEDMATPPFSPLSERKPSSRAAAIPPKALPTPPLNASHNDEMLPSSMSLGAKTSQDRPVSHILHMANVDDDLSKSPPLIPQSTPRSASIDAVLRPDPAQAFVNSAVQRHKAFIEQESQAGSDLERLQLFAEYMVAESRIRRDRYSSAFSAIDSTDLLDMTRDLWRPMQPSPTALPGSRNGAATGSSIASSIPRAIRTDSLDSFVSTGSPMSVQTNLTPQTEPESPASLTSSVGGRDNRWNRHRPQLSPILSMAQSTIADEQESRGRSASRWWESDSGSNGHGHRVERSRRESKYMGLHRDALTNLQWQDEPSPSARSLNTPRRDASGQLSSGYLPEKTGWHEENSLGSASSFQTPTHFQGSVPPTPDPRKLDVSRLVTLPPPYPRHYPAMHNSHPDLATMRNTLETLKDLHGIDETKEKFNSRMAQRRERSAKEAATRRSQMRQNIQEQLDLGQMSYASAAQAEQDFNTAEADRAQQAMKQEYDTFQPEVMRPAHALFSERITKATACITQIRSGLNSSAHDPSPNQPQEEGDEKPEILEKLNLLKWLYEARESLHKRLFDLEGEGNDRYKEVILTPMRHSPSPEAETKMRDAEIFFEQDARDRKTLFEKEVAKRAEEFLAVISENVTRGVEDQLNAFWDIAPGLKEVVQKVPYSLPALAELEVQIPNREMEENPVYEQYPLQYVFSLLTHAEKSAYQFIESQVNQFCLLHEAQTGVMVARIRLLETQRIGEGEVEWSVGNEMGECRRIEEEKLSDELKEKVDTVESQWREGLGGSIATAKERIQDFLVEVGGWDEGLME
ncbi:hypothetical protein FKW77_008523 [Venturia effusa]|uniref:Uncharacterized protein n=1 Tax=Venturia effusa TaxID=50376 RepID=A0A517LHR8_9PEZI|nr:hypothetical protein FKW77_008523 [Venturia effusa]